MALKYIINSGTLKTNLISCWPLNEFSSAAGAVTRYDAHGSNDLTDNNTTPSAAGLFNRGADFEKANSEYLSIADNASLSITGAQTWSCWFKAESITDLDPIFSKWVETGAQRTHALTFDVGKIRWLASGDGATFVDVIGGTTLSAGTWYHVVVTFTPSTKVEAFINGVSDGSDTASIPATLFNSTAPFYIGRANPFGSGDRYFDGVVQSVCVWNRVLTGAEITELYNAGEGMTYGIDVDLPSGVNISGSTTSYDVSHTCTGTDRALIVHVLSNNNSFPITGVTYAGASMTKLSTFTRSGESFAIDQYGLANPATGANNITTTTASATVHGIVAISYIGVDQTTPFPTTSTAIGNSATITNTLTVANDNAWIFAGTRTGGAEVSATGTNYFRRVSNASNGFAAGDSNNALTTGSKTVDVTVTSGQWGIALIELKPVSGSVVTVNSGFFNFM